MENQKAAIQQSWVQVPKHSDFTIHNLPFGIFKNKRLSPRIGIAIGDKIVDLHALQEAGFLLDIKLDDDIFLQESLNPLIALGRPTTKKVRERVQQLLQEGNHNLRDHQSRGKIMLGLKEAEMMMPVKTGDFTAFLSPSEYFHQDKEQTRVSELIPIGYHRKSSSLILSGVPVIRPKTHLQDHELDFRKLGPAHKLDIEMKMACVVGRSSKLGESIPIADAEEYIFGITLLNDWTIRDTQTDALRCSPFTGKNFACSVSPWIVTLDALESFRTASPLESPEFHYLQSNGSHGFEIRLEAGIKPEKEAESLVCQTDFKYAHWNMVQLIAHQTRNGSNIRIGDLIASEPASSPENNQFASIRDLTESGSSIPEGEKQREYIKNGETVVIKAYAEKDGIRVGFGEISAKVVPSKQ